MHPELPIEFLCSTDNTYLCCRCAILNHQQHQITQFDVIDKVKAALASNQTIVENLQVLMVKVLSNSEVLEQALGRKKRFSLEEFRQCLEQSEGVALSLKAIMQEDVNGKRGSEQI